MPSATGLRQRFMNDGYLVFPRFYTPEELEPLRSAVLDEVQQFDAMAQQTVFSTLDNDRGRDRYFMDSAEQVHCFLEADALDQSGQLVRPKAECINKVGHALHDRLPAYREFCRSERLAELLRSIGYQDPVLWQSMYIFKQPRIGGEVRWHQDASYLLTEPASVTGIWIALDDAHRENGCLWLAPGAHRSPLRERFAVSRGQSQGVLTQLDDSPWPSDSEAIPVEVPAGSLLLFHDHMPHYSAHNHSEHARHALSLHVAEASASWHPENWLQRPSLQPFRVNHNR